MKVKRTISIMLAIIMTITGTNFTFAKTSAKHLALVHDDICSDSAIEPGVPDNEKKLIPKDKIFFGNNRNQSTDSRPDTTRNYFFKSFIEQDNTTIQSKELYDYNKTYKKNTDIAYAVENGNIYFDETSGTITDCDYKSITKATIPDEINNVPVRRIGTKAFALADNLTEVKISDSVTEIGAQAFMSCKNLGEIIIPDSVIEIGESAFKNCPRIIHVILSNNLKTINRSTFSSCTSLNNLIIPDNIVKIDQKAFSFCSSLSELKIGAGVKEIGDCAFEGCNSLSEIEIPYGVEVLDHMVFHNCTNLTTLKLPKTIKQPIKFQLLLNGCGNNLRELTTPYYATGQLTWDNLETLIVTDHAEFDGLFDGELKALKKAVLPLNTHITDFAAFENCEKLESVTIPSGITVDNSGSVFLDCPNIKELYIGQEVIDNTNESFPNLEKIYFYENVTSPAYLLNEHLKTIEVDEKNENFSSVDGVLFNKDNSILIRFPCEKDITTYSIPQGVITIDFDAFSDCKKLSKIDIPNSVQSIDQRAFRNCNSLSSLVVPASVTNIDTTYVFTGCDNLKTAGPIGGGYNYEFGWTEYIPANAFEDCSNLQSINIPDSITSIKSNAFSGCNSLTDIVLPKGITEIVSRTFMDCKNLKKLNIPENVTSIDQEAFIGCNSLEKIILPNGITSIGERAFYNCSNLKELSIPNSVTSIGDFEPFGGCDSLEKLTLGQKGVDNGWKNRPNLKEVTILDGVTTIGESKFADNNNLKFITIPSSVISIQKNAFNGCNNLTICCDPDSYAETYAKENNIPYITISANSAGRDNSTITIQSTAKYTIGANQISATLSPHSNDLSDILWKSSNTDKIEIVDKTNTAGNLSDTLTCNLNCKRPGLSVITVSNSKGASASCLIEVEDNSSVYNIKIYSNRPNLDVNVGESLTVGAGIYKGDQQISDISNMAIIVEDSSICSVSTTYQRDNCCFVNLNALKTGTTAINVRDSTTGATSKAYISVNKRNANTFTIYGVPLLEKENNIVNFYNYNGLYIDSFTKSVNADKSANIKFDVYNKNYTYSIAEVYDGTGKLKDLRIIDKNKDNGTSIKGAVYDNLCCLIDDIVNGNLLSYKQASGYTKKTEVIIDNIPVNGYVKITSDPKESPLLGIINSIDLCFSLKAVSEKGNTFTAEQQEKMIGALSTKLLNASILNELLINSDTYVNKLEEEIAKNLLDNTFKSLSFTNTSAGGIINAIISNFNALNIDALLVDACTETGISFSETIFKSLAGPAGSAMNGIFAMSEVYNTTMEAKSFTDSFNTGNIKIQVPDDNSRYNENVTVQSEDLNNNEVSLEVYKIGTDNELVKRIIEENLNIPNLNDASYYNISLLVNGEEIHTNKDATVTINIPEELWPYANQLKIYRVEEDNSLTDMHAVFSRGTLTFSTDHFSLYAMVDFADEEDSTTTTEPTTETSTETSTESTTNSTEGDIITYAMGNGKLYFEKSSNTIVGADKELTVIDIPSSIENLEVKAIGDNAFSTCINLTDITIPQSIASISKNAFEGCPALTVHCYRGSCADDATLYPEGSIITYLEETVQKGDVNGDGLIDSRDSLILFKHIAGDEVDIDESLVDFNNDNTVDSRDSLILFRYVAGDYASVSWKIENSYVQ